jgi:hypothetical protein
LTNTFRNGSGTWEFSIVNGYFVFISDSVVVAGNKIGAFFGSLGAMFLWPELEFLGQTYDIREIGRFSMGMFGFMILGVVNQFKGFL